MLIRNGRAASPFAAAIVKHETFRCIMIAAVARAEAARPTQPKAERHALPIKYFAPAVLDAALSLPGVFAIVSMVGGKVRLAAALGAGRPIAF